MGDVAVSDFTHVSKPPYTACDMAIYKLELNKLLQEHEQVWSWQQSALWVLSILLSLKEDTLLETFKVKNMFMKVLCKRFQTDSPLSHCLLVTQFKYQWPHLEKFLRERGKYRACLCGQKMDVIPLLCPWLGAIEMLFRILFHQAQGQIFPAYLVQKRFKTHLRTIKFTVSLIFYVCHMDPITN